MKPVLALRDLVVKHLADSQWLVLLLYVLRPNHDIFRKDYFYERPKKERTFNDLPMVDNTDGFFNDLPEASIKNKKRGSRFLRLTKAERKQMKIEHLEIRKRELDDKLNELRNEILDE